MTTTAATSRPPARSRWSGAAASGKIEVAGDKDWFKTSLTEGKTYKVNVLGKSTGDGSLRWPKLTGIYNSSGERFPNTENYDHGFGLNPRKYFTASQTGDYFIGVTGYGRGLGVPSLGTYKVLLEEVAPDIPGDITTTASLTIDGTVTSEFDRINDDDWHKLEVDSRSTLHHHYEWRRVLVCVHQKHLRLDRKRRDGPWKWADEARQ